MKKIILSVICFTSLCLINLVAQAKIPDEYWNIPMTQINPVLAELYVATQGQSMKPFNIDPTPDILFNKLELTSIAQMDGTTMQTRKGAVVLSGNTVSVELLTYNGSNLILKSTFYILCNLQKKTNSLIRLSIIPTKGNSFDLTLTSYDMYGDPRAASDLAQLFTVWGQLFNVWYSEDSVNQLLRS